MKRKKSKRPRRPHWSNRLVETRACKRAVTWARKQPSARVAWLRCKNSEWMLWLLNATSSHQRWDSSMPLNVELASIARMQAQAATELRGLAAGLKKYGSRAAKRAADRQCERIYQDLYRFSDDARCTIIRHYHPTPP